jgi:hypothetical protein
MYKNLEYKFEIIIYLAVLYKFYKQLVNYLIILYIKISFDLKLRV